MRADSQQSAETDAAHDNTPDDRDHPKAGGPPGEHPFAEGHGPWYDRTYGGQRSDPLTEQPPTPPADQELDPDRDVTATTTLPESDPDRDPTATTTMHDPDPDPDRNPTATTTLPETDPDRDPTATTTMHEPDPDQAAAAYQETGAEPAAEPTTLPAPATAGDDVPESAVGISAVAIWGEARTAEFRDDWREAQLRFVDDPRAATTQAQQLVASAIDALTDALTEQRRSLDAWEGEDGDTERLRQAMRQYRTFFDHVLGL